MKAHLRSVRIAPKKANLIAKMVRGLPVGDAMTQLQKTNKKGARIVEQLLRSAMANAEHNDKQDPKSLLIKTIVVNQSIGYQRGVPKARGQMRPMQKFLSHISVTLGIADEKTEKTKMTKKMVKEPSQKAKTTVKKVSNESKTAKSESDSSPESSISSTSSKSSKSSS